jgi:hypothetical protein
MNPLGSFELNALRTVHKVQNSCDTRYLGSVTLADAVASFPPDASSWILPAKTKSGEVLRAVVGLGSDRREANFGRSKKCTLVKKKSFCQQEKKEETSLSREMESSGRFDADDPLSRNFVLPLRFEEGGVRCADPCLPDGSCLRRC